MKPKHGLKISQKPKRKDQLEIRSVRISPEVEINALARIIMTAGGAPAKTQAPNPAGAPAENLKTLISIANNTWRAKMKMMDPLTGEFREDLKRVGRHIEAICRNLAEVGIVIRDHTGDAYDEGQPMKVVASKPTPGQAKKRVSETLLPSIFWNDRLVQNGEIEIAIPVNTNTAA